MNTVEMIRYNDRNVDSVSISLSGMLPVVSARFSFPAPELNFSSWFTVPSRLHTEWKFIQERCERFFTSVSGLICTTFKKICRKAGCFEPRKMNILQIRILKLSFSGRRL